MSRVTLFGRSWTYSLGQTAMKNTMVSFMWTLRPKNAIQRNQPTGIRKSLRRR